MSTIVKLVQGSAEWHDHRRQHRNASETPIVLGRRHGKRLISCGSTSWGGRAGGDSAMLQGTELEPAARAAYEKLTGQVMRPLVLVEGEYSASLDGSPSPATASSRSSARSRAAIRAVEGIEERCLPDHYRWQMETSSWSQGGRCGRLRVRRNRGHRISGGPGPGYLAPDPRGLGQVRAFVTAKSPPPLSKGDVRERDDLEWIAAAAAYVEAKRAAEAVAKALDEAKAKLVGLASYTSESGGGVSVTRFWKRGAIDYKKIPEIKAVDASSTGGHRVKKRVLR